MSVITEQPSKADASVRHEVGRKLAVTTTREGIADCLISYRITHEARRGVIIHDLDLHIANALARDGFQGLSHKKTP